MKMTRVEKKVVNSRKHAQGNLAVLENLLPEIESDRLHDVLEIGCGAGQVAVELVKRFGFNLVATDADPEQIRAAEENIGRSNKLRFQTADASALPFGDEEFDIVLSLMVLHHIGTWRKVINECHRVLRPGGFYIVRDLAMMAPLASALVRFVKNYGVYSFPELETCLRESGFDIIKVEARKHLIFTKGVMLLQKKPW